MSAYFWARPGGLLCGILACVFLTGTSVGAADSSSDFQPKLVSLAGKDLSLKKVLETLHKQTGMEIAALTPKHFAEWLAKIIKSK